MGFNVITGRSRVTMLVIGCVMGCVTTPHTSRTQVNFIPAGQMQQLGAQAYRSMIGKEKLITRGPLYQQVVKVSERIAAASGAGFSWEFSLIDNDAINAFCLPGGKIGIYTGILKVAQTEAGLAAIIGHEVAHAILRHGAERMSQQLLLQAGLTVAQLKLEDSKQKQTILAALGIGSQFGVLMPFSRYHESEADSLGQKFMAQAGYDPREASKLWQRMDAKGSSTPEILSTHPDPRRRAKKLASSAAKYTRYYQNSPRYPSVKLLL